MVALRSRRLEAIFGASLAEVTYSQIFSLVAAQIEESFDLDFKGQHYGSSEADKRELAYDVAALANTAGGVLVLGIDEDEQACASGAPGVEISDAHMSRIYQIVASQVSPIPTLDVRRVEDGTREGYGFMLVAIPRSPVAPHAVVLNRENGLRYPRRHGTTTRYLSEAEVATAYRERLTSAGAQKTRVRQIEDQAIQQLNDENAWLVLTIAPDFPGCLEINPASLRRFEESTVGSATFAFDDHSTYSRAFVGRGLLYADDRWGENRLPIWSAIQMHTDGAATYSHRLNDRRSFDNEAGIYPVPAWRLALAILSGLVKLGDHAQNNAAAGGWAVVRARILPVPTIGPISIKYTNDFGEARTGAFRLQDPIEAETYAELDAIANPGPDLVVVAASVADELAQTFGLTQLGPFSREGTIRRSYWPDDLRIRAARWAAQNNVEVTA